MKKLLAILLACAMFLPILASCGSLQAGELDVAEYAEDVIYDNVADVIGYVPATEENKLHTALNEDPEKVSTYSGSLIWEEDYAWYLDFENMETHPTEESETPVMEEETVTSYETTRTVKVPRNAGDNGVYTINDADQFMAFLMIRKGGTLYSTESTQKKELDGGESVDNVVTTNYVVDTAVSSFEGVTVKLATDVVINPLAGGVEKVEEAANLGANPVATPTIPDAANFKGTFDGDGHVISGVYVKTGTKSVFGRINGGTVNFKNFSIINSFVDAAQGNTGVLIHRIETSQATVKFSNIYMDVCMVGATDGSNVGGFVGGINKAGTEVTFENCVFAGSIQTPNAANVGGFIGYIQAATSVAFNNCANYASATGACEAGSQGVGGFVGSQSSAASSFTGCTNFGEITSSNQAAGGFIGSKRRNQGIVFERCQNKGEVEATNGYVGGFLGATEGYEADKGPTPGLIRIATCENTADITSTEGGRVGGFVGNPIIGGLTIEGGSNTGNITGNDDGTGGAVGHAGASTAVKISITGFTNTGTISGVTYVGGVLGVKATGTDDLTLKDVTNKGKVKGTGEKIGGIIGDCLGRAVTSTNQETQETTVTDPCVVLYDNCDNEGEVIGTVTETKNQGRYVGGIAGATRGSSGTLASVTFTGCDNTGTVSGNHRSGGLIGFVQNIDALSVTGCNVYATMDFEINSTVATDCGGLIGKILATATAEIDGCEVVGNMSITETTDTRVSVGGLVGDMTGVTGTSSITDCYINLDFAHAGDAAAGDTTNVLNLVYGVRNEEIELTASGITYDSVDDLAPVNEGLTTNGNDAQVKLKNKRVIKNDIGMQKKDNGDGTYSLRYVFGVSGLSDLDAAIGFDVNVQIEGEEAREVTVYCPVLYTSIKAGGDTYTAAEAGVDYLFTLEIANVPADKLDSEGIYFKNGQITLNPFTYAVKEWNEDELLFKRNDEAVVIKAAE